MKKLWNGFIPGFITALLLVSLVGGALAVNSYQKQATLNYSGIAITLDGKTITPTDASGNPVEPFGIDGTTYLPVRGIANVLGLDVLWDGATQTVNLTTPGLSSSGGTTSGETALLDQAGIKIFYTGIDYDGTFGTNVKFRVENATGKTYTVQAREVSVNGYMVDPIMSIEVAAGKKANDEMTFMKSYLEKNAITTFDTIEMKFQIFASDDWSNSFETASITIDCK